MPTPSAPNSISMNQVNVELGRGGTTLITMNDAIVRTLAGVASGTISMDNLRGKSSYSPPTSIEYLIVGGGGKGEGGSVPGSGGSGVVILRYSNVHADSPSVTGPYTLTNTGGYKIYRWTGSGSIRW